jgi:tRNA (mo5U34)-methyltransferase
MSSTPSQSQIRELVSRVHWHQRWEIAEGVTTPGNYDPQHLFDRLELTDLSGMRVLDVGTADGFYAFQCEALGAEVVAIDHKIKDLSGFMIAKQILGSKVEYIEANVYDLQPEEFGDFDLVLFLGVLYHLRHPLLGLDRLRALVRANGAIAVESLVCDQRFFVGKNKTKKLKKIAPRMSKLPIAQFLSGNRFSDDATNQWAPNVEGMKAMVEDSGFRAERVETWDGRALVFARAIEEPELDWLRAMDYGKRQVP